MTRPFAFVVFVLVLLGCGHKPPETASKDKEALRQVQQQLAQTQQQLQQMQNAAVAQSSQQERNAAEAQAAIDREVVAIRRVAEGVANYLRPRMVGKPTGPTEVSIDYYGGKSATARIQWPVVYTDADIGSSGGGSYNYTYHYVVRMSKYGGVWKEDSTSET